MRCNEQDRYTIIITIIIIVIVIVIINNNNKTKVEIIVRRAYIRRKETASLIDRL